MSNTALLKWNTKYKEKELSLFKTYPSDFLVENKKFLVSYQNGRTLDIACGDGRNSLYLAEMVLHVKIT